MSGSPDWPVELAGVTESVVATLGPNGRWNLAPLGLFAPDEDDEQGVTARTWGQTRTRGNFERTGEGVVQFLRDPELFVECALGIVERERPVDDAADAWVRVAVTRVDDGRDGGTDWVAWELDPVEATVERRTVPTTRRGYAAVVEATVWASRLDADAYDDDRLRDRLAFLGDVVTAAGSERERRAFERIGELTGWDPTD